MTGRDPRDQRPRASARSALATLLGLTAPSFGYPRRGSTGAPDQEAHPSTAGLRRNASESGSFNSVPTVSFGLPVRNGASTLGQSIESVLAQTFADWELVISDNLSSDGTSELCASYAARDERIRYIPTGRDLSVQENFRAAFRHSRGTYFRWLGDDDWLEPVYTERAVTALEGSPESVLCTTVQQYYRDGRPLPVTDPVSVFGGVDSPDPGTRVRALLDLFRKGGLGIDPVYSMARRDVAARTGLQGSIRDGDFVYSCEMALLGPFVHVPEVLAHRPFVLGSQTKNSRNFLNASSRSSASRERRRA